MLIQVFVANQEVIFDATFVIVLTISLSTLTNCMFNFFVDDIIINILRLLEASVLIGIESCFKLFGMFRGLSIGFNQIIEIILLIDKQTTQ